MNNFLIGRVDDWKSYIAAGGIDKYLLNLIGQKSGAQTVQEAIQAAQDRNLRNPATWGQAMLGSGYTYSGSSGLSGVDENQLRATGDPDKDAENYAKKMGISVNEAKTQLNASYGEPQKPSDSGNSGSSGVNERKALDPEQDAKRFAKEHNASLDQSKEYLKNKYGEPQKP